MRSTGPEFSTATSICPDAPANNVPVHDHVDIDVVQVPPGINAPVTVSGSAIVTVEFPVMGVNKTCPAAGMRMSDVRKARMTKFLLVGIFTLYSRRGTR